MSVSIAIVSHIRRMAGAERLAEQLDAPVFVDKGVLGEWSNHEQAWQWAAEQDEDHALVIQDDAILIPCFRYHLAAAIACRPDDLISLYVGRQRPRADVVAAAVRQADDDGAAWLTHTDLLWGVAVLMPTEHIVATLRNSTSPRPYDRRLGFGWRRTTGRLITYCYPSLVDHDDTVAQITDAHRRRDPGRVAWRTGVPQWNEREIAIA